MCQKMFWVWQSTQIDPWDMDMDRWFCNPQKPVFQPTMRPQEWEETAPDSATKGCDF